MSFKNWILSEWPTITFQLPTKVLVWLDDTGSKTASYTINLADLRAEDWSIEDKDRYAMSGGMNISKASSPPPGRSFSAPLADGTYLNYDGVNKDNIGATVDPKAKFPIIRKDWAKFAQFINGSVVIKNPQYSRTTDVRVA